VCSAVASVAVHGGCNVPDVHFTAGTAGSDAPPVNVDAAVPGAFIWLRSLSQIATQTIASGPDGILTPGYLYSTADLGKGLLTSAGGSDLIVAAFTEADGTNLYGADHGNVGSEAALLGLESQGLAVLTGVTSSDDMIDLGLGPVTGGGTTNENGFIAAYANGVAGWVQRLSGAGEDRMLATTTGPGSTVYGAGFFEQTTNFNGGQLTSVGGRDILLARFNVYTGAVDLTKQYGGTGRDEVGGGGCASIDANSVVMTGFFDDTIPFGGTAQPVVASNGGLDVWVAKLDSTGAGIWAVAFGGPGDDRDPSVTLDANGDAYVTGSFTTSITFGATTLDAVGGAGDVDTFIAKLDGNDGSVIWAISFGSVGVDNPGRTAVDTNGHLAYGGGVRGAFQGGPTMGGLDALVIELSAKDGSTLWSRVFSTGGDDYAGGVAYGITGDLFTSIGIGAPYDFGQPVIGDPDPGHVLIRIAP
jgi:hypothetical protein